MNPKNLMFLLLNDAITMGSVIKAMLGATSGCTLLALHFVFFLHFFSQKKGCSN